LSPALRSWDCLKIETSMKLWTSLRKGKQLRIAEYSTLSLNNYYRSWLVVKESSYVEEIDFDKLFSSIVCYETVCLFLAIAVLEDWNIYNINVKTTYFYGDLDKEIYIE